MQRPQQRLRRAWRTPPWRRRCPRARCGAGARRRRRRACGGRRRAALELQRCGGRCGRKRAARARRRARRRAAPGAWREEGASRVASRPELSVQLRALNSQRGALWRRLWTSRWRWWMSACSPRWCVRRLRSQASLRSPPLVSCGAGARWRRRNRRGAAAHAGACQRAAAAGVWRTGDARRHRAASRRGSGAGRRFRRRHVAQSRARGADGAAAVQRVQARAAQAREACVRTLTRPLCAFERSRAVTQLTAQLAAERSVRFHEEARPRRHALAGSPAASKRKDRCE